MIDSGSNCISFQNKEQPCFAIIIKTIAHKFKSFGVVAID